MEIEKLPTEIAANIFSRLPFDSVIHCKCVSKSWCNLLQHLIYTSGERYFAHKHRSNLLENHRHLNSSSSSSSLPDSVLLMLDQSVDNNQTCEDYGDQLHYMEYIEDQNGFNCKAMKKFNSPLKMDSKFWMMATSSNGLICSAHHQTHDDSYLLYVCNPFLGEYVTLPNKFKYSTESPMAFGFGHVFSTDEYKVVRIVYPPGGGDDGNVEVYTLGGEKSSSSNGKWRSKGINIKCRLQCDTPGVLVNESFHWLTQKDEEKKKKQNIVAFDLLEEEFHEIPLPFRLQANSDFKIIQLEGRLCGIEYIKEERKMLMWKLKEHYYMENKEVSHEKEYWTNFYGIHCWGRKGFEHFFYWKKVDQSLLWMSNSSVVAVEHDVDLGPKMDLEELKHAILFHGIPLIKSFVSLTALGENDEKTIKDNNRKRKRDSNQRRKQKRRRVYIVYSSDDDE